MGCGEVCQPDQYCDEASGVCTECSRVCSGGYDWRCRIHCCGYIIPTRPPTSTVSGSAVPVYSPKATPQCDACSHVALYIVLSLALLLLAIVIILVFKHYRKNIKGIFNQCKGLFLTRCVSSSSREVDAEAQPLIDHWTEIVTCWRELAKLLDNKGQSQTEDEAVDCTCANLALDFKRWAGLFGKHGDRVVYTRHTETGEGSPGGNSEQPQTTAEFTGERSSYQTTTSEPRDKNVKPSSDKPADPSEIPPAQLQPPQRPQPPTQGAQVHFGKRGVTEKFTNDEAATPYKAAGNDSKNNTRQHNLTPHRGTLDTSQGEATNSESSTKPEQTKGQPPKVPSTGSQVLGNNVYEHSRMAAEGPFHPAQANETIPQTTGASSNAVSGTKEGQPPSSPTKVPHSPKSRQQDPGAPHLEGCQPQSSHHLKTTSAASRETQGAQPSVDSRRATAAQTPTTRASQAPGPQTTGPVQRTNGGKADRAANNHRAEENEKADFNLRSDNSGGAAASAPTGEDSEFTLSPPTDYTSEVSGLSGNSPTEWKRPYGAKEPGSALCSPSDHPRPSQAPTHEEAMALSSASTANYDFRSDNTTSSNPGPSGQPGGRPQPDSVNSESHLGPYWPHPTDQPPVSQDRPGNQLSLTSAWSVHPKSN